MLIETTFMKYGKDPGGMIGITLKPKTMKIWALSLHTCSNDLENMRSTIEGKERHKEESDRSKITKMLMHTTLLILEEHKCTNSLPSGRQDSMIQSRKKYQQWQQVKIA